MAYAVVPLVIAALTVSARAEIRIEGSASNVRVEARDATVADVLAALAKRFAVRVRGAAGDRRISADFDGPLRRVIARVLKGYDYVIQTSGDGLEVMVLGAASSNAETPPVYRVHIRLRGSGATSDEARTPERIGGPVKRELRRSRRLRRSP